MFEIPPIPSFDALHPSVSHFPIALLLVAPVLLLLALCLQTQRRTLAGVALGLMVAGTAGVYLAAATGDAARDAAKSTPELKQAIAAHEDLGSATRAAFSGLTALLAALLFAPRLLGKDLGPRRFSTGLFVLLVLGLVAGVILINAAHSGGLLVHKYGVHARIS